MTVRRALLAFVLSGLSLGSTAQTVLSAAPSDGTDDDQPAISLPTPAEQGDPDSLNRRLAFAQSLAESRDGDCAARLNEVQAHIDALAANPAFDIIVPDGRARLASTGYRLHLGRAYCGNEEMPRKEELQAALNIAQEGVSLYRDLYDYKSMAVMQYDVAVTWNILGEKDKAVAALEAALAMDADDGFADDAAENGDLLQRWNDQASPPAAVPARSVTLKFGWASSEGNADIASDFFDVIGGSVLHGRGTATLRHHVRADGGNWILASDRLERRYDFEEWRGKALPSRAKDAMIAVIADLLPADLIISGKGEFKRAVDAEEVAKARAGDLGAVGGDSPPVDGKSLDIPSILSSSLQFYVKPEGVESKAAEDYSLAVSAWTNTTMQQGIWYDMSATLYVPGIALGLEHDISFAYSRPVPCSPGAAAESCAEILVHATPNPDAQEDEFNTMMRALKVHTPKGIQFSSATDLRLVVDPATLRPYATETRRRWYLAIEGKGEPLIGFQKTVATYSYR